MKVAINIYPLKSGHKNRGIGLYTNNLIDNLKEDQTLEIQEFADISEIKDADVVHYPWFDFFFHTLFIKKTFPTVVTIHDVIPLKFRRYYPFGIRGKFNFYLQRLALKNCQAIISDSQVSKKDIIEFLKINENRITTIPLAASSKFKLLSTNKLIFVKRKYNLPDQFLLYVGDANYTKNLPFLIEGFNEIIKVPQFNRLKLVLAGGVFLKRVDHIDHPELESLKKTNQLIEQHKLQNQVIRPGNLEEEELVAFYNLATVYIQPSFYEGFGLSVLQALATGAPVISSNGGSLPEVAGEAAVYFDPSNLKQFKLIAMDVLQNKSLQAKLSKLGLKQAEKFSWKRVIEQTKEVYSKVRRSSDFKIIKND